MLLYIDECYPRYVLSVKNLSKGKTNIEYIVKHGGWSETSNLGCYSFGIQKV